jgi:two-component system KDP operon response regulator KdpE
VTKILVVDDNPMDRHLVSKLLRAQPDWIVELASNGRQAIDCLAEFCPDLIVTDLRMPDIDGLQLVREVRH